MFRHFVRLLVCGLITTGALLLAGPVSAGTYDVDVCHSNAAGDLPGWSHTETTGSSGGLPYWYQSQSCSTYGIYRRFQINSVPNGAVNNWTFTAPADTTVSSFYHDGTATPTGSGAYDAIFAYSPAGKQAVAVASSGLAWNGQPTTSSIGSGLVSMPVNTSQVQLEIGCAANPCPGTDAVGGYSNAWAWTGGYVRLRDDFNPAFDYVGGSGWDVTPIDGQGVVDYRVSDRGAGVKNVRFYVDGHEWGAHPANCQPIGTALIPCPLTKSGSFSLDTTQLSEGQHLVALTVEDATGTVTPQADETRTITVRRKPADAVSDVGGLGGSETSSTIGGATDPNANAHDLGAVQTTNNTDRGAPNGSNAGDGAKLTVLISGRASTRKIGYGKTVKISGRLVTATGEAIAGARLSVQRKLKAVGAAFAGAGSVATSTDGRFSYVAPAGPSRTIRFAYRAFSKDLSFASTKDVLLLVKGALTLRAPKHVRNRTRALFTGVVKGRPVPSHGVLVDLQVFFRKQWRTFGTPRSNAKGVYKFRYRFTQGSATWRFRARNRHDSAHPYELAYSRLVTIKVTP